MQKDKFEKMPAGTVIKFPGYKGSFAKAYNIETGTNWKISIKKSEE